MFQRLAKDAILVLLAPACQTSQPDKTRSSLLDSTPNIVKVNVSSGTVVQAMNLLFLEPRVAQERIELEGDVSHAFVNIGRIAFLLGL